jgi:hypothetical protein
VTFVTIAALVAAFALPGAQVRPVKGTAVDYGSGKTIIAESPTTLASRAGYSVEEFALGRLIASEGYGGEGRTAEATARTALAQAVVNEARRRKMSIVDLLTRSSDSVLLPGFFGSQKAKIYAATTKDPTKWDLEIARAVLRGSVPDLAKGATNFLDPEIWGGAIARGTTPTQGGYALGKFEEIITSWHKDKAWIGPIPGVDSYYLMLFRKEPNPAARAVSLVRVLDVYRRGIRGDHGVDARDPDGSVILSIAIVAGFVGAGYLLYRRLT